MEKVSKEDFLNDKEFYLEEMREGKIFIYPTDTIYGIGGVATYHNVSRKIRSIKGRDSKPFSIIAPSKDWIHENFTLNRQHLQWLEKLPGPYTLILDLERDDLVDKDVVGNAESIGVRIPDNWFTTMVQTLKKPFITTSVNVSGEPHSTSVEDIPVEIKEMADYIVDDGVLEGNPSTIVDLREEEPSVTER